MLRRMSCHLLVIDSILEPRDEFVAFGLQRTGIDDADPCLHDGLVGKAGAKVVLEFEVGLVFVGNVATVE